MEKQTKIQPYQSKELAGLYNISLPTFYKWLVPIRQHLGLQIARMWNINQVKKMFEHFGTPE